MFGTYDRMHQHPHHFPHVHPELYDSRQFVAGAAVREASWHTEVLIVIICISDLYINPAI